MPCASVWVTNFETNERYVQYMCWPGGELEGVNEPPDTGGGGGGGGSSSGVTGGGPSQIPGPQFDAVDGDGSVVVAGDEADAPTPVIDPNPGWNGGAHSIEVVPADWNGVIFFDVPDIQGARQGGVAAGLALETELPTIGRNGYAHLRYGLVFTVDLVRVIHGGVVVAEFPYADIRAERFPGEETDYVAAIMYGNFVKWQVNDITLWAGIFAMPGSYALDATLYLAFDAVDNPEFIEGDWGDMEDGSLNFALPAFEMTADASPAPSLIIELPAFAMQMSEDVVWNMFAPLGAYTMTAGDSEGLAGSLGAFTMIAADVANYSALVGSLGAFGMTMGMAQPDSSVSYSVLMASLPRLQMSMTFPPMATLDADLPAFVMRASAETQYSELVASLPPLRMVAYGGDLTPFIQILESIGARVPVYQSVYVALILIERVGGDVEAVGYATITAEAMNKISAEDAVSYSATLLDTAMEMVGFGERLVILARRNDGGSIAGEGEAWVVNTRSGASTRYDQYGFNSFATVRGKQYGMATDGLYLLEGDSDAGAPIKSGVHLGMHDFGTQQEKGIRAVYAGVSSTGCLFMKIDDGCKEYAYRATRNEQRMRIQRFDPGQGLSSNYFSFELVSDADAFELDNVKFDIIASQRRI